MRSIYAAAALALLGTQVQAQSLPQVSCATDDLGSIFNTTNTGNWQQRLVTNNEAWTNDQRDEALNAVPFSPAVNVTNPPTAWIAGGGWISHSITGAHSNVIYSEYRIDFDLVPAAAASFAPQLNFYADNAVIEAYVNGVPQASSIGYTPPASAWNHPGYTAANAAVMTLPNDWQANTNSLVIRIISAPSSQGFRADFTGDVACPNMAPEAAPTITGTLLPGSVLTGTYQYSDAEEDAEGDSLLRWVRSDDDDLATEADNVDLGNTTDTYTVQPDDALKNIFFCVTPIAVTGQPRGAEACTKVLIGEPSTPPATTVKPVPVGGWTTVSLLAAILGFAGIAAQRRKRR